MNNEKVKKFLEIVQANPDLPIIPMVDSDVVADDGNMYWQGSFGYASVEEYFNDEERMRTYIKSNDFDELAEEYGDSIANEFEDMPDDEFWAMCREKVNAMPWKKAIIVYIDTPDEDL